MIIANIKLKKKWLDTGTSIKCGGVKLVLWVQPSPLSEMMLSCKCLPHASNI